LSINMKIRKFILITKIQEVAGAFSPLYLPANRYEVFGASKIRWCDFEDPC